MIIGTEPTTYSDTLTGLSERVYQNQILAGVIPSEAVISTTINSTTYTETSTANHNRIFQAKLNAWAIAKSVVDEITANAQVNNISSIINTSWTLPVLAVPVPSDGGAAITTTFKSNLASNNATQTGTVS